MSSKREGEERTFDQSSVEKDSSRNAVENADGDERSERVGVVAVVHSNPDPNPKRGSNLCETS